MTPRDRHPKRRRSRHHSPDLKDRLIQTRVPESLQSTLKEEARKRRLSVSHLIRNVLEDTFDLVDNVVAEVDNIVQDSVGLARQVRRDAERIAQSARDTGQPRRSVSTANEGVSSPPKPAAEPVPSSEKPVAAEPPAPAKEASPALEHILAWNRVVLNRDARCAKCGCEIKKGQEGHLGVSQAPATTPTWLCSVCLDQL